MSRNHKKLRVFELADRLVRLGLVTVDEVDECRDGYNELARSLQKLHRAFAGRETAITNQ